MDSLQFTTSQEGIASILSAKVIKKYSIKKEINEYFFQNDIFSWFYACFVHIYTRKAPMRNPHWCLHY